MRPSEPRSGASQPPPGAPQAPVPAPAAQRFQAPPNPSTPGLPPVLATPTPAATRSMAMQLWIVGLLLVATTALSLYDLYQLMQLMAV